MEPFEGWERGPGYEDLKKERSAKLYEALERVIPDIRERVVLEMVGSPLTHQHWMRRYKGEEFRLKKGRKKRKKIKKINPFRPLVRFRFVYSLDFTPLINQGVHAIYSVSHWW